MASAVNLMFLSKKIKTRKKSEETEDDNTQGKCKPITEKKAGKLKLATGVTQRENVSQRANTERQQKQKINAMHNKTVELEQGFLENATKNKSSKKLLNMCKDANKAPHTEQNHQLLHSSADNKDNISATKEHQDTADFQNCNHQNLPNCFYTESCNQAGSNNTNDASLWKRALSMFGTRDTALQKRHGKLADE